LRHICPHERATEPPPRTTHATNAMSHARVTDGGRTWLQQRGCKNVAPFAAIQAGKRAWRTPAAATRREKEAVAARDGRKHLLSPTRVAHIGGRNKMPEAHAAHELDATRAGPARSAAVPLLEKCRGPLPSPNAWRTLGAETKMATAHRVEN